MRKLVFVNRYFYPDLSATSQILTDLTSSLVQEGKKITVVTSRLTYDGSPSLLPAVGNYEGVRVLRVWTTNFGRSNLFGRGIDYFSFYIMAFFTLLRVVRKNDVLIAKTDPPLISVVAWCAAKIKGVKLINWLQDVFPEVAVSLGVLTWKPLIVGLTFFRNLSLRAATANIVLGSRMYDYICSQGVSENKVIVINNWTDEVGISPVSREDNKLIQAWGLDNKFVVGYSGNMGRAHEFDTIVAAMNCLRDEEDIFFIFIGAGAGKNNLEKDLKKHGLKNYAFYPYQPCDALSQSLSVPDVHLVSLRPQLEGFIVPSKIYGIFSVGRPLFFIGDKDGEVSRLVAKFNCGESFALDSGEMLGERLRSLKMDVELRKELGNNGRQCLEAHFGRKYAISQWLDVVKQ